MTTVQATSDILLTEEELRLREEIRKFIEAEVDPELPRLMDREEVDYPTDYVRKLGAAGHLAPFVPPQYGGAGRSFTQTVVMAEEIGVLGGALTCAWGMPSFVGAALLTFGSEDIKQRYLVPTVRGELIAAEAITEPTAGSDAAAVKTRAERDGDSYVLNGYKRFQAGGVGADYFIVFARTNPDLPQHKGIGAFVVDRGMGVRVEERFELMGFRGVGVSELVMRDARVPRENLVGGETDGWRALMWMLAVERLLAASSTNGMARECLAIAVKYARQREAYGRPIREMQGVSFKIADMVTRLDAARALTLETARMVDKGMYANRQIAETKLFASEAAWQTANDAMQILGGIGYTTKFPIERYLRDCRLNLIFTGTSEVVRDIIQKEVYRELRKAEE